jgi:hypothetical protein
VCVIDIGVADAVANPIAVGDEMGKAQVRGY